MVPGPLSSHMAPRCLTWCKAVTQALPIYNSTLAGGRWSNAYSRLALYGILEALHNTLPGRVRCYVDDLAQPYSAA